jgi:hypothetical protein
VNYEEASSFCEFWMSTNLETFEILEFLILFVMELEDFFDEIFFGLLELFTIFSNI